MEYAEFPENEYQHRLERLQAALRHDNVDFGLFCSEQNYRYVTGHHTETWLNPTRPMAVWVPAEGAPVAVVCESEIEWFRQTSWIERAATYDGLSVGPDLALGVPEIGFEPKIPDAIIEAARMVGVTPGKRVGWEFGSRSRMNMPQMVIQGVQSGLDGVEWVDAASLMWGVRAIKSEREVECLRVAVKSLDGAFEGILQNLPSGISERDVARKLKIGVMQHGADRPGYVNVVGDVASYPVFSAPTSRSLREGCLMYIDGGSVYRGYWSD